MTTTKPQSTTETLKPCPFCGSVDLDLSNGYDEDANWVVICRRCKASGTFCVEKSKAIARWNARIAPASAAPVVNNDLISRQAAIRIATSGANIRMVGGSTGDALGTSKAIANALRDLSAAAATAEQKIDEATMDWALRELADGWIQNNEREGQHGFYQNARRVLNAIVK